MPGAQALIQLRNREHRGGCALLKVTQQGSSSLGVGTQCCLVSEPKLIIPTLLTSKYCRTEHPLHHDPLQEGPA